MGVIAAFEDGDEATVAVGVSQEDQAVGQPLVVEFGDGGVAFRVEVVPFMSIETGRDKDEIGFESFKSRQNLLSKCSSPSRRMSPTRW